nr:Arm DNA-binding domain-containing protein [Microbacterium sp. CFH 90308]
MGSIAAYQAAAGRRYRVRWRDDTTHRQVEKRGFKTKRDAELFLARTEVARSDGSYTNPAAAKATVRELGTEWLRNKRHSLKASSYSSLETSWRVYVLPRWSDTRIGDIRASQVEQWIRELSEGTAPRAARRAAAWRGARDRRRSSIARSGFLPASSTPLSVTDASPATSLGARRTCRRNDPRSRDGT